MALRALWQFMDRDVTHKILQGSKRSRGPYTIWWVTDRSINCHFSRSAMIYLLHLILTNMSDDMFFAIVYLRPKSSPDKIRKKTLY